MLLFCNAGNSHRDLPSVLEQSPAQMGIRAMAPVVFLGVQNPPPDCNHSQLLLIYMGHDLV